MMLLYCMRLDGLGGGGDHVHNESLWHEAFCTPCDSHLQRPCLCWIDREDTVPLHLSNDVLYCMSGTVLVLDSVDQTHHGYSHWTPSITDQGTALI